MAEAIPLFYGLSEHLQLFNLLQKWLTTPFPRKLRAMQGRNWVDFLKEWVVRMDELKSGKITRDKYWGWKINWPQTCDSDGKFESKINVEYPYKSSPPLESYTTMESSFLYLCDFLKIATLQLLKLLPLHWAMPVFRQPKTTMHFLPLRRNKR